MKLELKYLAPYLPYGLQMKVNDGFGELIGINKNFLDITDPESVDSGMYVSYADCKPLLRPYEDVIKPIKIGNMTITPALDMWNIDAKEQDNWLTFGKVPEYWRLALRQKPTDLDYHDVRILFEYHFDVFGLLVNGLAIQKPQPKLLSHA